MSARVRCVTRIFIFDESKTSRIARYPNILERANLGERFFNFTLRSLGIQVTNVNFAIGSASHDLLSPLNYDDDNSE